MLIISTIIIAYSLFCCLFEIYALYVCPSPLERLSGRLSTSVYVVSPPSVFSLSAHFGTPTAPMLITLPVHLTGHCFYLLYDINVCIELAVLPSCVLAFPPHTLRLMISNKSVSTSSLSKKHVFSSKEDLNSTQLRPKRSETMFCSS